MSPLRDAAGEREVGLLLAAAEEGYRALGLDPREDPHRAALALKCLSDDGWRALALVAGCRPSSPATRAAVIRAARERPR